MGLYEFRERDERSSRHSLKHKLRKIKELMEDVCEEIEDDMSERDGDMYERDGMSERRGVRGTGRYSRY